MGERKRPGLDLAEDLPFQHANWRAERIGWGVMALVLAAGLAGLFGHGPLAAASAGAPDAPLRVAYERLVRHQADAAITCQVAAAALPARGPVRIWVATDYLRDHRFDPIVPAPEREVAEPGRVVYEFAPPPPGAGLAVTFHAKADGAGPRRLALGLVDGPSYALATFVFP